MSRSATAALTLIALAAMALAVAVGGASLSSATFVASSSSIATVRAASDWTPPTVALAAPGASVKGTVTLTATAADQESGVRSVDIQYQVSGGDGWTTVCSDTGAPYSCPWNTTTLTDGHYDLRAVAADDSGLSATSDQVRTVVANNVLVVLTNPGELLRGTVPLTGTVYNGLLSVSIAIEYAAAGTGNWTQVCSGQLANPRTCDWNTTARPTGLYDLRAKAVVGGTTYTSAVIADVLVDNSPPVATMADPGTPLRGTATFAASASDVGAGVAQVVLQYAAATGGYQTLCTIAAEPWSCRYDTTRLTDGAYSFRAVATDLAGNVATTAAVTDRVVDNTVSAVSVEDPGGFLNGTVAVNASASSTAGVTSVRVQAAPTGTSTWTDLCTDASAPYSCPWDTTTVADGPYDLRAVLTDGTGKQTVSAAVTARRVDNAPLRGVDVQTANGGGTAGRITSGDTVTFGYSRAVAPGTVATGWTGAALNVTARVRDGSVAGVGTGSKGDTLDVRIGTTTLNLGSVNLKEDYLKTGKTVTFNATLQAATVTVDGVDRTVVTLTIGTLASGMDSSLRTVALASGLVWTPSAAAQTLDGGPCSTAPVVETGAADREF